MKTIRIVALVAVLTMTGAVLVAQAHEHPIKAEQPAKSEHPSDGTDIFSVAAGAEEFSTFVACVKAAGLEEKFQSKGPFTVFAPTDAAFAKLPEGTLDDLLDPANKAQLAGLLANHVVPGKIMSSDMKTMKATNVSGQDLDIKVSDDGITCNAAHVVQADVVASNGVIYAIDTVIVLEEAAEHPSSEAPKDHPAH
jgi:uncharacterized surface protein with fasciclin (FAS1) repeats